MHGVHVSTTVGWRGWDCYMLSWGSPELEFRFRFRVLEAGVGMDGASVSGLLR